MEKLILLLFFISCGVKVKHEVSGTVALAAPKTIEIDHVFKVDETVFLDACTTKYKDIASTADRNTAIDNCVKDRQTMVEQLISTLNKPKTP